MRDKPEDSWLSDLAGTIWKKPEFSMVPIDFEPVPEPLFPGTRPHTTGLRVVFAGIPSDYGVGFLLHLLERRANLVAVVCSTHWQRAHPKPDLIARIASHLGLPIEVAASVNSPSFVAGLVGHQPDLVVMASFDQILHRQPLAVPRLGWINIHPSLLPHHRGPEPIYWTIAQGDRQAGITLHWAVEKVDAGPVLAQRAVPLEEEDTSGSLCKRLVQAGFDGLDETLTRLAGGDLRAVELRTDQGSYEPPVRQVELDWDQPFLQIDRLLRAGRPDQPAFVNFRGERCILLGVRRLGNREGNQLGILEEASDSELRVAVRDATAAVTWRQDRSGVAAM